MYKHIIFFLLFTTSALATDIYCPITKKHLYTTEYDILDAILDNRHMLAVDFIPEIGVPEPDNGAPFICPFDQTPLNGYEFWFTSRGLRKPIMAYSGITIFTKIDGKYQWYPYNLDIRDG